LAINVPGKALWIVRETMGFGTVPYVVKLGGTGRFVVGVRTPLTNVNPNPPPSSTTEPRRTYVKSVESQSVETV
jgi:hypothetical protein